MYDAEADAWAEVNALPRPTMGLSVATVDDQEVWVMGGITCPESEQKEKRITSDVFVFNSIHKRWSEEKSLSVPHAFACCVCARNTIWIVGGCHPRDDSSSLILDSCSCVWTLDLQSHSREWKHTSALSSPTHASSAVLCGKDLYVFGGIRSKEFKATDAVEVFNTSTNTSRTGISLPASVTGSSALFLAKQSSENGRRVKTFIHPSDVAPKRFDFEIFEVSPQSVGIPHETAAIEFEESLHPQSKSIREIRHSEPPSVENFVLLAPREEKVSHHRSIGESPHTYYFDPLPKENMKMIEEQTFDLSPQSHVTYFSNEPTNITMENNFFLSNRHSAEKEIGIHSHQIKTSAKTTNKFAEEEERCFKPHPCSSSSRAQRETMKDHYGNRYVTTLEVPLLANGVKTEHDLSDFRQMKTEIILEGRKWKPVTTRLTVSSLGSDEFPSIFSRSTDVLSYTRHLRNGSKDRNPQALHLLNMKVQVHRDSNMSSYISMK
ncbi:beta-scruin [Nephila pilipes]|uniref:Beta-scruin n=1 Tax=Nephila pilipes TaxID=299642 RepID=A0A8X6PX29_NEPPI|nr:beta-scruin [Nephila pilipes]